MWGDALQKLTNSLIKLQIIDQGHGFAPCRSIADAGDTHGKSAGQFGQRYTQFSVGPVTSKASRLHFSALPPRQKNFSLLNPEYRRRPHGNLLQIVTKGLQSIPPGNCFACFGENAINEIRFSQDAFIAHHMVAPHPVYFGPAAETADEAATHQVLPAPLLKAVFHVGKIGPPGGWNPPAEKSQNMFRILPFHLIKARYGAMAAIAVPLKPGKIGNQAGPERI